MKFFYRDDEWRVDKRNYLKDNSKRKLRQIDKIKNSLPCSVTEAFVIIGVFFENPSTHYILWDNSICLSKLINLVQQKANENKKDYFLLFYDDDSPVLFRGTKISLFLSEEEMKFEHTLISKRLDKLGSNVVLKFYKITSDF